LCQGDLAPKATQIRMRKERLFTWIGIAVTIASVAMVYRDIAVITFAGHQNFIAFVQAGTVALLITALVYGSLVYLFARSGYLKRLSDTTPVDQLEEEYLSSSLLPRLTILIPSYKEELRVLRQTILSAALCVYGERRIVVLIDDPQTATGKDRESLELSRDLLAQFNIKFHTVFTQIRAEYAEFLSREQRGISHGTIGEMNRVATLYDFVSDFVEGLLNTNVPMSPDKADEFLKARIIIPCAERYRKRATQLRTTTGDFRKVAEEFQRLMAQLQLNIQTFERKKYRNLSHAANKAMNLNSYIGLLGKCYRTVSTDSLPTLEECPASRAHLIIPDAKYLLTLDADSMVLPDYLLKLVNIMERDSQIAVAQTPYSAIPGQASALERAAGAQTDLQYILHQGSTAFNATFWVGANALLRVSALRSIVTTLHESGNQVPVYIQDRTVIEDTGSTVDLIRRGWQLHNHLERLAYSATPPDFGSLVIQRRRWANGGLIIFPELLRYAVDRGTRPRSAAELFLRTHYLCGPALTGLSVLLLLLLPLDGALLSVWLPGTVLPYYALYVRDARSLRYRWNEILNVYTLNLMLLPIILAGVFRSVQQAFTGCRSSFGRTPKTDDRTAVQPLHLVLQFGLLLLVFVVALCDAIGGHTYLALFWAANFCLLVTGFPKFIGVREAWRDLAFQINWRPRAAILHRALYLRHQIVNIPQDVVSVDPHSTIPQETRSEAVEKPRTALVRQR
jgi:cellulose synthase/poly-beta-1,6-N-acetylglucosamine synthase-like glycosyltransferase